MRPSLLHGLSAAMGDSPACTLQLVQLYGNINSTLLSGAGDRLGLTCSVTGEGLPVAVLPYCGRPLLESLIRDVQVGILGCFVLKLRAGWSALAALAAVTCWLWLLRLCGRQTLPPAATEHG